jgi:copper homeostasis protein
MLEICVTSPQDAIIAYQNGAQRIELCANLDIGGTTPSYSDILNTKKSIPIPVHVLIRPRGGNFVYNDAEVEKMILDIQFCKSTEIHGVVLGVLDNNISIDIEIMKIFIEAAKPMQVVFHKAFDEIENKEKGIIELINLGVNYVLTAGTKGTAIQGKSQLKVLLEMTSNKIIVMPGGNIRASNILQIMETGSYNWIHSAARIDNQMQPEEIKKMVMHLRSHTMLKKN